MLWTWGEGQQGSSWDLTMHPYVITIYVMAFSLVLNFRLNYSYQRYWESASQLFMMTSKWVDAATILASFHYQADIYRPYRPDPFGQDLKGNNIKSESDITIEGSAMKPRRNRTDSDFGSSSEYWKSPSDLTSSRTNKGQHHNRDNPSNSTYDTTADQSGGEESGFFSRLFGGWSGTALDELDMVYEEEDQAKNISSPSSQDSNLVSTKRPTYHRRIPSVDLPRPGTAKVKSFHPTPAKDWDTTARTNRLSHIPNRNKSDVDLESWLLGRSTASPSSAATAQRRKRTGNRYSTQSKRRSSLPPPKRKHPARKRERSEGEMPYDDSTSSGEIDLLDTIHSGGVSSERKYRHHNSSGRSSSQRSSARELPTPPPARRRSSGVLSSLLPFQWGTQARGKSLISDEFSDPGGLQPGYDPSFEGGRSYEDEHITVDADDEAYQTSSTNSSQTENFILMPTLFLQEAAHLFSLMSAVAMSSLRADLEGCASPLVEYMPGQPFPPVNPDEMKVKVWLDSSEQEAEAVVDTEQTDPDILNERTDSDRRVFAEEGTFPTTELPTRINNRYWIRNNRIRNSLYFLLGISRSPRQRTLYNASRPFAVMGGLSDNEVELLQKARGPEAQMALCMLWLKEFVSREHLDGSTGKVAPPIIARIYQYVSDGFSQYNQCRKTAYTQFPFVHTQLTTFFLVVSIFMFPFLYYTYVNDIWIACFLNFASLSCFAGIIEVAREMQDPFYQFPNDLPLNNYQVQYNEALISCMYGGFHPDAAKTEELKTEE
ncbi:MAG: hypothetical protein SGILL_008066 [Bacillariaceae sp.]